MIGPAGRWAGPGAPIGGGGKFKQSKQPALFAPVSSLRVCVSGLFTGSRRSHEKGGEFTPIAPASREDTVGVPARAARSSLLGPEAAMATRRRGRDRWERSPGNRGRGRGRGAPGPKRRRPPRRSCPSATSAGRPSSASGTCAWEPRGRCPWPWTTPTRRRPP